jgi:hypothetical protein
LLPATVASTDARWNRRAGGAELTAPHPTMTGTGGGFRIPSVAPTGRRYCLQFLPGIAIDNHPYQDPVIQQAILSHGTRDEVIQWLTWNDRNGTYTDADSNVESIPPLTLETAREVMADVLAHG